MRAAAWKLLKRLLRNQPVEPEVIVTDGLPRPMTPDEQIAALTVRIEAADKASEGARRKGGKGFAQASKYAAQLKEQRAALVGIGSNLRA